MLFKIPFDPISASSLQRHKTMSKECEISEEEKIKIICRLLHQAPPGEFSNIFEDLRILVWDDHLMRNEAAQVYAIHNKNNFTAVRIRGGNFLVTHYNDLGGDRFFDPQSKFSFRFDHLTGKADTFLPHGIIGDVAELWRQNLNIALKLYMRKHFASGDCRVFRKNVKNSPFFVVCIAAHQYKPLGFRNSLWKSKWTLAFAPPNTEITGIIHLQIHYFRESNLHMIVKKTVGKSIYLINGGQFALDFAKLIEAEDNKFQMCLVENLQALSDEIWRTLRRQLPITRTAINWDKLLTSRSKKVKVSGSDVPLSLPKCLA